MSQFGPFFTAAQAILTGEEDRLINIGRFKHIELLRGLHALLYSPRTNSHQRRHLRIGYGDGSESASFLIPAQPWPVPVPSELQRAPLRLGFLSGRHPELDSTIDFYLLRNREIKLYDSPAEQEQEVYERTLRLFQDAAFAEPWRVEVYHTGLEAVTAGFYRAVVELAQQRRSQRLPIIPLLPRIWRKRSLNVTRLIKQAKGALDRESVITALEKQAQANADFLEFKAAGKADAQLLWRLERPMYESERDLLCRQAPNAEPAWHTLWQFTQYQNEQPWGLG